MDFLQKVYDKLKGKKDLTNKTNLDLWTFPQSDYAFFARRRYFNKHLPLIEGRQILTISYLLPNSCPSCGFPTLSSRSCNDICRICFWQDDGQDDFDLERNLGPNGISLYESRKIWQDEFKRLINSSSLLGLKFKQYEDAINKDSIMSIREIKDLVNELEIHYSDNVKSKRPIT